MNFFWKSVNICRSYGQFSTGSFFMKHGVHGSRTLLCPAPRRGIKQWCCQTSDVCLSRTSWIFVAPTATGSKAHWAPQARCKAWSWAAACSVEGRGISWRPPAYSLLRLPLWHGIDEIAFMLCKNCILHLVLACMPVYSVCLLSFLCQASGSNNVRISPR